MSNPTKGEAFTFELLMKTKSDLFANDPPIASGDAKVFKDGGAAANVASLPTLTQAGEPYLTVALSATEMDADRVMVKLVDQSDTKAWADVSVTIQTVDPAATEAKQDSIIAALAAGATVRVPLSEDGETMNLILGDYYSDQVMLWTVEIDYRNDFTGVLTITDRFDKSIVHKRVPVSVLSATQIAAPFTAEFDSNIGLCGSPQIAHLRFALTMIEDIGGGEFNETTPQLGDCFVKARGTTSA